MSVCQEDAITVLGLIDLTNLEDDCNSDDVKKLCDLADTPYGSVAAVCIWPQFVPWAKECLKSTDIKIATVVNFPSGDQDINSVISQAREAVANGADEVDLVMPYKEFLKGHRETVSGYITQVKQALPAGVCLKVIIESGELRTGELVSLASRLAIQAGADFIKTSTGKVSVNATLEVAEIMLHEIQLADRPVGFKAAGGIKRLDQACSYLKLASESQPDVPVSSDWLRFGASSLLANVLSVLEGKEQSSTAEKNGAY